MSIKVVVHIMERMDLPRPWAAVLMAMGDHADDEGKYCYPSVDKIAWKANYKPRQVINIMRDMERGGIITKVRGATQHRPAEYQINLDSAPRKLPFDEWRRRNGRGAISQQEPEVQSRDPGVQSDNSGVQPRDPGVQPIAPEPSNEPSNEPPVEPPMGANDASPLAMTDVPVIGGKPKASALDQRFDRWYQHYPKKKGKADARRTWNRIRPDEALTEQMIAAVKVQEQTPDWQKANGQFIPYPARWLNAGMWEDEVGTPVMPPGEGVRQAIREASRTYSATDLLRATPLPVTPEQQARLAAGERPDAVLTAEQLDLAQAKARKASSARRMFNIAGKVF